MTPVLSTYLDLIRFTAALVVFIGHANADSLTGGLPVLWRLADRGADAVMVFFVLSGFVIAYVVQTKEHDVRVYTAARLSRLWSVAIPALLMTFALDAIGTQLAPQIYDPSWYESDKPLWRLLVSLLFANELWFGSLRAGTNGAYWSLGYEFWYYAIFGAVCYFSGWVRAVLLLLLCAIVGPKVLALLPIWLAGVWAYRTGVADRLSAAPAWALFIGSLIVYGINLQWGGTAAADAWFKPWFAAVVPNERTQWPQYFASCYLTGAMLTLNLMSARAVARHWPWRDLPASPVIRYAAGFTFALYLFHTPLLHVLAAATTWLGLQPYRQLLVPGVSLLVIWLIGGWCEAQKAPLKRLLQRLWPAPAPAAADSRH